MKYATASEHREFFRKNRFIEFDQLLTLEQLSVLNREIEEGIKQRQKVAHSAQSTVDKTLNLRRDLWRQSPVLKKIILQGSFAEIAAELVEQKPIRIAYDQFFPKTIKGLQNYPLIGAHSLEEMSSLQGILCGLMLCLADEEEERRSVFASKAGNGVFFQADLPIDFEEIPSNGRYLLIVYCQKNSVYYLQEKDPQTHYFKKLGYTFGDKLTDTLNPVLFR